MFTGPNTDLLAQLGVCCTLVLLPACFSPNKAFTDDEQAGTSSPDGTTDNPTTAAETSGPTTGPTTASTGSAGDCGDGVTDPGEQCDDSGESATCDADCTAVACGDGMLNVSAGETCDDAGESETCNIDCTGASCGDSTTNVAAGEECDDGQNGNDSDDCTDACLLPFCGDGVVQPGEGEACDDMGGSGVCNATCAFRSWGVNRLVDSGDGLVGGPRVALDLAGNAMTVWSRINPADFSRDIFASRYSVDADAWGAAELLRAGDVNVATTPEIVVDDAGNFVATWRQEGIFAKRYQAASDSWGPIVPLGGGNASGSPYIAANSEGTVMAVWHESVGGQNSIVASRYSHLADSWSGPVQIEMGGVLTPFQIRPHVAMNDDGAAVAIWNMSDGTNTNIYSSRYDSVGNAWGSVSPIENEELGAGGLPRVALDDAGNAVAVWHQSDGTRNNILTSRFDAVANSWGMATLIETENAGPALSPTISMNSAGDAMAIWQQFDGARSNIAANRFSAENGTWALAELIEFDNTGNAVGPELSMDSEGNVIAVWVMIADYPGEDAPREIRANRYDASATSWGTEATIGSDPGFSAYAPHVAVGNGGAVALWGQSLGSPPSTHHVRANHYR